MKNKNTLKQSVSKEDLALGNRNGLNGLSRIQQDVSWDIYRMFCVLKEETEAKSC